MTKSIGIKSGDSWQVFESQREVKDLIQKAVEFHRKNEYAEAEKVYRQLLKDHGDQPGVLNMLGVLLYQTDRWDEAIELLNQALALDPDNTETLNNLGACYRNTKNWEEAAKVLRKAVGLNRYGWQGHANLAKTEFELNNFEDAIKSAEEVLNLTRDDPIFNMHKVIADCCVALKDWKKAEKHFRLYLQHFPQDAEAYNNLAFTMEHNRDKLEALDLYKKAYETRKDSYELAINYGNILMFFRRYSEASVIYREALELKPQHLPTYTLLIQCLLYQFDLDKAYLYSKMMATVPGYEKSGLAALADRVAEYVFDFDEDLDSGQSKFDAFEARNPSSYGMMILNYIKYCKDAERTLRLSDYIKRYGKEVEQSSEHLEIKRPISPIPRKHSKIRLGLLSSDMRTHVVCKFLIPLIRAYNRDSIEIRCYSPLKEVEDRFQKEIREKVHDFHYVEKNAGQ
jgi:tetratricopeptide (TPR) repeat protein